jgi:hypothetical protein
MMPSKGSVPRPAGWEFPSVKVLLGLSAERLPRFRASHLAPPLHGAHDGTGLPVDLLDLPLVGLLCRR